MNDDSLCDLWLSFQRNHECSIERMQYSPKPMQEFLSAERPAGEFIDDEKTIL
jgi:hypothetical protein